MALKGSKTAGKRTSRPGSRSADLQSKMAVGRRKGVSTPGKKSSRITTKHIIAHQRAAGRRRNNPARSN